MGKWVLVIISMVLVCLKQVHRVLFVPWTFKKILLIYELVRGLKKRNVLMVLYVRWGSEDVLPSQWGAHG